jgi:hypothetical protein
LIRSRLPLAALFVAACAPTPPPAPIAAVPASPPIVATAPPVVEEAPLAPVVVVPAEPTPIELPEIVACALPTTHWVAAKDHIDLRVQEGGPVFARVWTGGTGSLHLPVGSTAEGAVLELSDQQTEVRGHIASADIWLHPARVVVLGGAVIPLGEARLPWASAKPGAVTVAFEPKEGIVLAQPPLTGDVPCDALSLRYAEVKAEASLPNAKSKKRGLLRRDTPVPLSLTAGGPSLATLVPSSRSDATVTVIESAGANSRIFWTRERSLIFGWVPTASLEFPPRLPVRTGSGTGTGSGFGGSFHPPYRVVCPDDVPAIVDVDGRRWAVGRILAGTRIDVMDREGTYRKVQLHGGTIRFGYEASLIVAAARIAACPHV